MWYPKLLLFLKSSKIVKKGDQLIGTLYKLDKSFEVTIEILVSHSYLNLHVLYFKLHNIRKLRSMKDEHGE
jgi:hypothetical protein